MARCINIDWLEVYALEPVDQPHTADFYRAAGLLVEERDYGTRIYNEMFTIYDDSHNPIIEVRRNPKQAAFSTSILPINACHIRLSNRMCYSKNAVAVMQNFLDTYHLTFSRIYRIDICLDFERFDCGDEPGKFLFRYIKGKYSKINQVNIAPHGKDRWDGRQWNYCHWGSLKSPISTKLYNKTLELAEVHDKPYIRQSWFNAGLVTDPVTCTKQCADGTAYRPTIWRVEFSIRSGVKNWLTYEADGEKKKRRSVRNTLNMYDTEEKLLAMFATLQEHYFHFRHYKFNKAKWDCPRKTLFRFKTNEVSYRVEHPSSNQPALTKEQRLLKYLREYQITHTDPDTRAAVLTIQHAVERQEQQRLLANPYSLLELKALQLTIAAVMNHHGEDPVRIFTDYLDELKNSPSTY